jgi:hypothetical protein
MLIVDVWSDWLLTRLLDLLTSFPEAELARALLLA